MKKQYDEYLCANYPKLYKDRHGDMKKTCMVWGFDVGDGWFNILNGLSMSIQGHIWGRTRERWRIRKYKRKYDQMTPEEKAKHYHWDKEEMPPVVQQVVVQQVKEKFGGLRFYYYGGDETIENFVRMAEAMSLVTCEECGAPGTRSGGGWISVRCQEHGGEDFFAPKPITEDDLENANV